MKRFRLVAVIVVDLVGSHWRCRVDFALNIDLVSDLKRRCGAKLLVLISSLCFPSFHVAHEVPQRHGSRLL